MGDKIWVHKLLSICKNDLQICKKHSKKHEFKTRIFAKWGTKIYLKLIYKSAKRIAKIRIHNLM